MIRSGPASSVHPKILRSTRLIVPGCSGLFPAEGFRGAFRNSFHLPCVSFSPLPAEGFRGPLPRFCSLAPGGQPRGVFRKSSASCSVVARPVRPLRLFAAVAVLGGRNRNLGDPLFVTTSLELGRKEGIEHLDRLVVGDETRREDDDVGVVVTADQ